ncbi:MAG: hypothetical protein F4Z86_03205 [Gemmatimonadetes bacterium]|nr:hypothetical protein [Gemmatimonadota bacterium]MYB59257.1 hypothetical protein [Gemmatimonadota bacterium]
MAKTIKLGQLIRKTHIKFCDLKVDKNLEVLGVSNIEGITRTTHKKSADLSNYLVIKPNSFAYNPYRINVGSIGLTPSAVTGIVSPAYIVFQVDEEKLIPEVLLDFLKSDEGLRQINRLARGTVRKALRYDDLCEIDFPNLSFAEQEQLVRRKAKLDTNREILLSEISHQETLLTKLKQAILQEAIRGKLTVDWRKENSDVEPASQLLERIQQEKQRLIAEKKIRKEKPLPPITPEEIPFEIPDSWEWCRLGEIAIHSLGKMLDKGKNKGKLLPYIRNLNVQWFDIQLHDLKQMRFEDHELEKYAVECGDIVICEGGYPGRAAIWQRNESIMFQKALHRVRFILGAFDSRLFVYFLKLADEAGFLASYFTGAGIKHFTGKALHRFLIPLPPLAEQDAIVERVESLMNSCRQLETEVKHSRTNAEDLLQVVLKEAFTSKTV